MTGFFIHITHFWRYTVNELQHFLEKKKEKQDEICCKTVDDTINYILGVANRDIG